MISWLPQCFIVLSFFFHLLQKRFVNYVIHPTFYQREGEKIITVFSFFIELFLSAQRRQLFQANYINMNICFVTGTLANPSLSVQIASGSCFMYLNWNFKKVGQISFLFLTLIRKYSIHVRHESRNLISSCFCCRMHLCPSLKEICFPFCRRVPKGASSSQ